MQILLCLSILQLSFFWKRKFNSFTIKIINHVSIFFCYHSGCLFTKFKCLIWHQRKHLLSLFFILIIPFIEFFNPSGKSMYVLPINGLKTEIFTYWASIDSISQPDPSLIQLSIPYKISWKDLSRSYSSELIIVLV